MVLSVGFVKNIISEFLKRKFIVGLELGWALLVLTLLLNLGSHLLAIEMYKKTIKEIDNDKFDETSINRFGTISMINWLCVLSLISGIVLILIFIIQNI